MLAIFVLIPAGWPIASAAFDRTAWHPDADDGPRIGVLAATTAALALGVLICSLPAGVLLALTLFRLRVPLRPLWCIGLASAAFTPLVLYSAGWESCIGPYGLYRPGPIANRLAFRMAAAIVIHALAALPWICALVGLGLLLVNRDSHDQARLDGNSAQVLIRIDLPLAAPAITLAGLVAIVPLWTDMTVTDLFRIRTIAEEVYTQIELSRNAHPTALAALLASMLLAAALTLLLRRWHTEPLVLPRRPPCRPLDRTTAPLALFAMAIVAVACLPIVGLVRQVGLEAGGPGTASGPVLRWSAHVAGVYVARQFHAGARSILAELVVSLLASGITVAAAVVLVWYWRWAGAAIRSVGLVLLAWLFVLPGPLLGLGLIEIFHQPGLLGVLHGVYDTPLLMLFGKSVRALPFALAVLGGALLQIDKHVFDAVVLEGAHAWQILWRIACPALWRALVVAGLVVLAFTLGELPATLLLAPPGTHPFVVRVFGLLHTGTGNEQAAIGLVLLGIIGLASLAGYTVCRHALIRATPASQG